MLSAQIKYFIPTLKLKNLRPLPLKSLLLLRNCKFVVVLNGCFCYFDHMCTCLFLKYNIDTETRSVIYGIGIHTVSSYQHNIACKLHDSNFVGQIPSLQ